jgi:hypothetical protein
MPENPPSDETPIDLAKIMQQQEVDRLVEANKAGFAELASMGAQVDAGGLLNLRIEILAEMMFGDGPGMVQFKLRFERKVAEVLEDLRGQVRKAQLGAAAQQFSPQQIRQMAKSQGLLDGNGNPVRR